jgi:signal transduction histidine kinase
MKQTGATHDVAQVIARTSIARKLPAVAAVLILLVGLAVTTASYLEVRHSARAAAFQRIADLVRVTAATQRTGSQLNTVGRLMAERPAIIEFLNNSDEAHRAAALEALRTKLNPTSTALVVSEIRDGNGDLLLTTDSLVSTAPTDFPPRLGEHDTASVGKLRLIGDSLMYPANSRIPGGNGAYVVQWRHASTTSANNGRTRQALGGANILMGNIDGSYWTDLTKLVPRPPGPLTDSVLADEYTRSKADGAVLAGRTPLPGTPFAVAVEFPLYQVMAPVYAFLRSMIAITLLCVALGVLLAWWLARHITAPLRQLTTSVDAFAAGRPLPPLDLALGRRDELGRLAHSFQTMSAQIDQSRLQLERQVTGRTEELRLALDQLRETQGALVRREKLAMLGQLAGGVGHELRNPLGVMSNAIYYLEMVLEQSPDEVRDYLRLLREQVNLSTRIVGDLLDMARIAPPQRREVQVADIVKAQLARINVPENVDVLVGVDDLGPVADVDPLQVGQIVFNLLTNAMQAIGDAAGTVRVEAVDSGERITVHVSDSGPGVEPEIADKIFEPLFTTKARGIGLGLAVSRALAQANGGDLRVERPQPGQGATFVVEMPAAVGVSA